VKNSLLNLGWGMKVTSPLKETQKEERDNKKKI
jgi:hypothetical protein